MSEVMLVIIDREGAVHGEIHGSAADAAVASLSAEPETIDELRSAMARFSARREERPFAWFVRGECEEPWDAGIVIVDLAARVVAIKSTCCYPSRQGKVRYRDRAPDVWVHYTVPDDWFFTSSLLEWEAVRAQRRSNRAANPPLDHRAVLYGEPLTQFIAAECSAALAAGEKEPIPEIHRRWLMTPRTDLRGQTPRQVLLAKRNFIDLDLQWRANQWSLLDDCPPGLSSDTIAYRFSGFGTHENVIYYDLVRFLLDECWRAVTRFAQTPADRLATWLNQQQAGWLNSASESYEGMSPAYIIDRERRRMPIAVPASAAAVSDDCPLCRMVEEDFGPMFWHLDGSHMDDDFAFSFYLTREEWEEEQRRFEEFNREFERTWADGNPGEPGNKDGPIN